MAPPVDLCGSSAIPRPVLRAPSDPYEVALVALREGLSDEDAAARFGTTAAEVTRWRARFLEGAQEAFRPRRVFQDVAAAVGDTPLVRLNGAVAGLPGEVYAKLEFTNPMGSVKDRVARHMVQRAAADGRLSPGDTIVESSSGNTAMGLGMMAALGGYRCKVAVRDRTSPEKLSALRAMGVELHLVDASLPPEHPDSYNRVMSRVVAETPGAYFPDQHNNRENNEAHYLTTGPEIWEQMQGRIDVLVAGVGTGGTISGVARYLKERDPSLEVVGVDPVGSIFTPYFNTGQVPAAGPYLLEGLGDEDPIECVEWDFIDRMLQVESGEAFRCARELARLDAIFAGGSSGAALWAVRRVLAERGRHARVVTIFPDSGSRYLSTIYDDTWMRSKGYL
ncbi:MAG: pyridoxal-phosphate dependent enzyme [Planctomycetota bacterium]